MARRRRHLVNTIGVVAQVWKDPNEPEVAFEDRPPPEMRVICGWCSHFDMQGEVEEVKLKFTHHLTTMHPDVDPNPPRGRRKPDTRKA